MRKKALAMPKPLAIALPDARAWAVWIEGDETEYHAIINREDINPEGMPDLRWHVSVSSEGEVPRWAVIAEVVHGLRPGVPFCLSLPPKSWWLNLHEFTLHAFEIDDENLIAQWRAERQGDTPS